MLDRHLIQKESFLVFKNADKVTKRHKKYTKKTPSLNSKKTLCPPPLPFCLPPSFPFPLPILRPIFTTKIQTFSQEKNKVVCAIMSIPF